MCTRARSTWRLLNASPTHRGVPWLMLRPRGRIAMLRRPTTTYARVCERASMRREAGASWRERAHVCDLHLNLVMTVSGKRSIASSATASAATHARAAIAQTIRARTCVCSIGLSRPDDARRTYAGIYVYTHTHTHIVAPSAQHIA